MISSLILTFVDLPFARLKHFWWKESSSLVLGWMNLSILLKFLAILPSIFPFLCLQKQQINFYVYSFLINSFLTNSFLTSFFFIFFIIFSMLWKLFLFLLFNVGTFFLAVFFKDNYGDFIKSYDKSLGNCTSLNLPFYFFISLNF